MQNLIIDIEDTAVETRDKKSGGTYDVQTGYAHLVDRAGNPELYPSKINIFPKRDAQSRTVPYAKGKYVLGPGSFRVGQGRFLELGFVDLVPVKSSS